jgi:nicotinamidase-related amidase
MTRALLVIDMQTAVVPALWRGEELIDRIARLVESAHAEKVLVVAVQQTGPPGTPFDPGQPGWPLDPRLGVGDGDVRMRKTATDSFFRTGLLVTLTEHRVDTLIVTGAATDYCVDATVRSALSHGFDVDLVSDGHAPAADGDARGGLTPEQIIAHHNQVLKTAIHPGGRVRLVAATEVFPSRRS